MAVETGIATNHIDLLVKLNTFLTTNVDLVASNQEWELLQTDLDTYLWKGPGLSSADEIFMSISISETPASNYYSWLINSFMAYIPPPQDINSQGSESGNFYINMWNDAMNYWFIANGQRFIVVVKVGSTYHHGYFGKINSYFRSGEYPYPVLIHGMNNTHEGYVSTNNMGILLPSDGHGAIRTIAGVWGKITSSSYDAANTHTVWPHTDTGTYDSVLTKLVPFDSGDSVTLPIIIISDAQTTYNIMAGELDGVIAVPGRNLTSESTLTIDGDSYILFQNGARIGTMDFLAVRLV